MRPVSSNRRQRQNQGAQKSRPRERLPSWVVGVSAALAVGLASFGILSALIKPPTAGSGRATLPPASPADAAVVHPTAPSLTNEAPLSDEERVSRYVNRGTELFQEGKFEEAAIFYADAVKLAPEDETAHFDLALALGKLGRLEEAKQHYLEALRIFPDYAEAHNNLGNLLASQGQLSAATEQLNEAVKAAPDSASAHNNLGTALMRQGMAEPALEHFAEAVRLMPDYVEAHCNLGNAYLARGRTNEAVAAFEEALRLKPNFEPANRGLARAQQKR